MTPWLVPVVFLLAAAAPVSAQHFSIGVTVADLRTTTLATPAGELVEIPRYTRQVVYLDAGYAVTDRLTALGGAALYHGAAIDQFGRASGVGDVRVGLNALMGEHRGWFMTIRGVVQAPTGDPTKGGAILPTGSGVWEGEGAFSVARALGDDRLTGAVEIGHRMRGGNLRDAVTYGGQLGVRVSHRVTIAWVVRGLQVYQRQPGPASIASASGLGDGVTYTAFGPTASIGLAQGLAVVLGVDRSAHTRNVAKGLGARIGIIVSR